MDYPCLSNPALHRRPLTALALGASAMFANDLKQDAAFSSDPSAAQCLKPPVLPAHLCPSPGTSGRLQAQEHTNRTNCKRPASHGFSMEPHQSSTFMRDPSNSPQFAPPNPLYIRRGLDESLDGFSQTIPAPHPTRDASGAHVQYYQVQNPAQGYSEANRLPTKTHVPRLPLTQPGRTRVRWLCLTRLKPLSLWLEKALEDVASLRCLVHTEHESELDARDLATCLRSTWPPVEFVVIGSNYTDAEAASAMFTFLDWKRTAGRHDRDIKGARALRIPPGLLESGRQQVVDLVRRELADYVQAQQETHRPAEVTTTRSFPLTPPEGSSTAAAYGDDRSARKKRLVEHDGHVYPALNGVNATRSPGSY